MILSKEFPYLNNHGSNTCFLYQISSPRGCGLRTHASSTETLFRGLCERPTCTQGREKPFLLRFLFQLKQTTSFHSWESPRSTALNTGGNKDPSEKLIKTMDLPSKKKKKKKQTKTDRRMYTSTHIQNSVHIKLVTWCSHGQKS